MSSGYHVDLQALQAAEEGITATLGVLREAGIHGMERGGAVVERWKLDVDDAGHQVIADGLDAYLDRLHYWVRGLIGGTEHLVRGLADTRSTYQRVEQEIGDTLRSLGQIVGGNPLAPKAGPR